MTIFFDLPVLENLPENRLSSKEEADLSAIKPLLPSQAMKISDPVKPEWLKIRPPQGQSFLHIKKLMHDYQLHTVCAEAHCPNLAECWLGGTATIMIGGDVCTRACRFCAVKTARRPPVLNPLEPFQVAECISKLGLKYVVLTSVDRDDLEDGGAAHFGKTISEIKRLNASILVEALVPDFSGNIQSIQTILRSHLDVYAHNIETTRVLHPRVRDPRANYEQSLFTLQTAKQYAKQWGYTLFTKSSLMLGLGEEIKDVEQTFCDLRAHDVDFLTLGQYLRPSPKHLPVARYLTPEEFEDLGKKAKKLGFLYVVSGPMIRSSYRAGEFFIKNMIQKRRIENGI